MRWEVIAAVIGGLAVAWGMVAWPRIALVGVGLLALILGLLSLATLKMVSTPAAAAIFVGVGLIGLGAVVAHVQTLLVETRTRLDGRQISEPYLDDEPRPDLRRRGVATRVEPRLWTESESEIASVACELVSLETVDPFGSEDFGRHVAGPAIQGDGIRADEIYSGLVRMGEQPERAAGALLVR